MKRRAGFPKEVANAVLGCLVVAQKQPKESEIPFCEPKKLVEIVKLETHGRHKFGPSAKQLSVQAS